MGKTGEWVRKKGADYGEWTGERPFGAVDRSHEDRVRQQCDPKITHDLNMTVTLLKASEAIRNERWQKRNKKR